VPIHTIGRTYKTDAGTVPISAVVFNVDTEINQAILVPAGAVAKEVDVTFAYTRINDYCITILNASGSGEAAAGSLIVDWNVDDAGVPTFTLVAKAPLWHAPGMGTTNLFTANATKFFVDNPGTVDLVLSIHIGLNDAV
jgi:hypothetical protein